MQGLELGPMQGISHRRAAGQVAIERLDQPHRTPVAHLPLSGNHRASPGLEQWGGETLNPLTLDNHAARRATGREHHQIGVEVERRQLAGPHQPTLAPAG